MSRRFDQQFTDPKGGIVRNLLGDITFAEGSSVPTAATSGYAPGCIFLKRDGAAATNFYKNDGTRTSCSFVAVSLPGVDLAGLLATADEINRATDVSTRLVAGGASLAITLAAHDGKTIVMPAAFAGTLPAATGSGARFRFVQSPDATAVTITATGAHMFGRAIMLQDGGDTMVGFEAAGSTVITFNGSTTGGLKGSTVEIEDVATNVLIVRVMTTGTGTEATPFS
jgi:hypothetical protein